MEIKPDDEIYRVNAVWLGPPKATMPWAVRYVSWGIGLAVFFGVLTLQRAFGIGMGFFSVAWGLVITVVVTRLFSKLINYERPLGAVLQLFAGELRTPRERTDVEGGRYQTERSVRVGAERPRPGVRPQRAAKAGEGPERRAALSGVLSVLLLAFWAPLRAVSRALLVVVRGAGSSAVKVGSGLGKVRVPSVRVSRPQRPAKPFPHRGEPLPRAVGPVVHVVDRSHRDDGS